MLFTGSFDRSLDDKGRLMLPKRIRKMLEASTAIFLTPGTDGCLELHTSMSLGELANRAKDMAPNSKTIHSFSRLFYAQAEQLEIDAQGRIRIPSRLIEWADLESSVTIVGVGFNWEIWNPPRWREFYDSQIAQFDSFHQSTFDGVEDASPSHNEESTPKPR